MEPVFIFCVRGAEHIVMAIWSVKSLLRFNYNKIEIVVSNQSEKNFIKKYLPNIECEIINVDLNNYRMWAWRPFALKKYNIKNKSQVVICDADILWLNDPRILFKRFHFKPWIHKITSLDPGEFFDYSNIADIPRRRIGLRTMIAYKNRVGINNYPNFHLNCGLFMLDYKLFIEVLDQWVKAIKSIPPEEMIMTEALLAIVYSELEISPISDYDDIKYVNLKHRNINSKIVPFSIDYNMNKELTGYQIAKHYYGDQRNNLINDVIKYNWDSDNLSKMYKKNVFKKNFFKYLNLPLKIIKNF